MIDRAHVSDHAILRYLERAHDIDVEAVRRHLAGYTVNATRLGAIAVQVESVKLVLEHHRAGATVVTTIPVRWPPLLKGRAEP